MVVVSSCWGKLGYVGIRVVFNSVWCCCVDCVVLVCCLLVG